MGEKVRICTPIYGEKFEQMYELFTKLMARFVPGAIVIAHHYNPPGKYRQAAHGGDWGKAEATLIYTKDGPVFIMDVDAMLIYPVLWKPENKNTVLGMLVEQNFPIPLPQHRGLQIIQDVGRYAGLLGPEQTASVNPQFFWAGTNLLPLYEEMDAIFSEFAARHNRTDIEYMWSLTTWTLVWLKLRTEGRAEILPYGQGQPCPLWHCPMLGSDRLSHFKIFADWMMKEPVDSPKWPPTSLFGF